MKKISAKLTVLIICFIYFIATILIVINLLERGWLS